MCKHSYWMVLLVVLIQGSWALAGNPASSGYPYLTPEQRPEKAKEAIAPLT